MQKQMRLLSLLLFSVLLSVCSGCSRLHNAGDYWIDDSKVAIGSEPRIQFLIFHYTAENDEDSVGILTGNNVSAHYLIRQKLDQILDMPVVLQFVPESQRAWHAGASFWSGRKNLNDTSIGIEIVNPGYHKSGNEKSWVPYSDEQIDLLISLSRDIIQRYGIKSINVLGHSDVSSQRKIDPGPLFPWKKLAEAGIGAWPQAQRVEYYLAVRQSEASIDIAELQTNLSRYGYKVPANGILDDETRRVIKAFQMHFRPDNYSGVPDAQTLAILDALLEGYRS